jgi:hypothetical protein
MQKLISQQPLLVFLILYFALSFLEGMLNMDLTFNFTLETMNRIITAFVILEVLKLLMGGSKHSH